MLAPRDETSNLTSSMSAKPAKKHVPKTPSAQPPRPPAVAAPTVALGSAAATPDTRAPVPAALDPRRSVTGTLIVAAIWLYVAALWLLALDQTFNWGIFGPKTVAVP